MFPVAGESAYQVDFYFVFFDYGEWQKIPVTETNNVWSGSALTRDINNNIIAYLVSEKKVIKDLDLEVVNELRNGFLQMEVITGGKKI